MSERRLTAILIADAVGFTARMAENETAALRAIVASLEVLRTVVALHGGQVVKSLGDGVLAEFGSVVNAVIAAAAMQDRLAERARDLPPEGRFDFRIGVHVGDVVAENGDLFGDGVNIAARLEKAAGPAEVLISARVHDDIAGKLDLAFEDRGEQLLKGLPRPLRAFALPRRAGDLPHPPAPDLPEKPSLAVLPLVNMSSDPEDEYFADGLTDDIITGLAAEPGLFVIARNSSFVYKGAAVDVRKVGRDLGVRYVLEGSVRRAGPRLRVTGQLVDTGTGAHLWAGRMDGQVEDVFDLQDRMTEAVVAAAAPRIQGAEIARACAKRPENLTAYDLMLKAMAALNRAEAMDAIPLLDRALALAPEYGKALAIRAWCNTVRATWTEDAERAFDVREGIALARRALATSPGDPEVEAFAGYTLGFFGEDFDHAVGLLRRAVERCPSFGWAWVSIALLEAMRGDASRALDACTVATRLNPRDPMPFRLHSASCLAHWARHDWPRVLESARLALMSASISYIRALVIVAHAELGREAEVGAATALLRNRFPDFRIGGHAGRLRRFENLCGAPRDVWCRRLTEAGLPD